MPSQPVAYFCQRVKFLRSKVRFDWHLEGTPQSENLEMANTQKKQQTLSGFFTKAANQSVTPNRPHGPSTTKSRSGLEAAAGEVVDVPGVLAGLGQPASTTLAQRPRPISMSRRKRLIQFMVVVRYLPNASSPSECLSRGQALVTAYAVISLEMIHRRL